MADAVFRFGQVALIGRPNVGKSTLLNRLVGQKLSIVTRRAQTTRHRIVGILNLATAQIAFVDTPGMHTGQRGALSRYMNRAAEGALDGVDLVLFMVEAGRWSGADEHALKQVKSRSGRVILVVNKIDRLRDKRALLPFLDTCAKTYDYEAIVPIGAERGENVERLVDIVVAALPEGEPGYPSDQVTDRSLRFMAGETVREKLTRRLGDELPYGLSVEIEEYEEEGPVTRIGAVVWIERAQHKPIVIGKGGQLLKRVGSEARQEIEALIGTRVYLRLWVKVRDGWSDDERVLHRLGYRDE